MEKQKNDKIPVLTIVIGCTGFIVCAGVVGVASILLVLALNPPAPFYLPGKGIPIICNDLEIPSDDPFCETTKKQTLRNFRDSLRRIYPPGNTHYSEIASRLESYPSVSAPWCSSDKKGWVSGNCPETCDSILDDTRYCTFKIEYLQSTSLDVWFDIESGMITEYFVRNANAAGS